MTTLPASPFAPRRAPAMGAVNRVGLLELCRREMLLFLNFFQQALLGPAVTALLFLAVFALALGGTVREAAGMPYLEFLAPGLIAMAVMQNAFVHCSLSLLTGKVLGNIVNVLMAPLANWELLLAYAAGGIGRGACVGALVALGAAAFVPLRVADPLALAYFGISGGLLMGLLGVLTGIWAEKFDHAAWVSNYLVTPLSFLSGTFYSIERLPGALHAASQFNPFFYAIDGFRYALTGHADAAPAVGAAVLAGVNVALALVALRLFRTGYRLKQ